MTTTSVSHLLYIARAQFQRTPITSEHRATEVLLTVSAVRATAGRR